MIVSLDSVLTLSNQPPTPRQRRLIYTVIAVLLLTYSALIPFLGIETAQPTGFIGIVLTLITASNFIAASLLFAQYMLTRSAAFLVLANGYLYSSLLMIPYLLSFPGIFSPKPVLSEGVQTEPFLYICWHFGFLSAVCCYVALKPVPIKSARLLLNLAILITVGIICTLVWVIVRHNTELPRLVQDNLHPTSFGRLLCAINLAIGIFALALLWIRRRSLLDYWLTVVVCLIVLELSLVTFVLVQRNTLGVTLGRGYFAVAAILILVVLLTESSKLYGDIARANQLLQRE